MAVLQKAIGVAWGMGAGFALTGLAHVNPLRSGLQRSAPVVECPNLNGETVGLVFYNQTDEIELTVYPSDTTLALAIAAAGTLGLNIGDKLILVNTDDVDLAGNKIVMKIGKTRKVDGYVEFTVTVKKWPTDLSTTIAA